MERDGDKNKILIDICDRRHIIPLSVLRPQGEMKSEEIKAYRLSKIFLTKNDPTVVSPNRPHKGDEDEALRLKLLKA